MRTVCGLAIVVLAACSSGGSGGVETNRYPGGEVMPIGGPPTSQPLPPIPPPLPPACRQDMTGTDATDGALDSTTDASDSGGFDDGGSEGVASDGSDAGSGEAAGSGHCLYANM